MVSTLLRLKACFVFTSADVRMVYVLYRALVSIIQHSNVHMCIHTSASKDTFIISFDSFLTNTTTMKYILHTYALISTVLHTRYVRIYYYGL